MPLRSSRLFSAALLLLPCVAFAGERAQGFIVTKDSADAYKTSSESKVFAKLGKGEALVGFAGTTFQGHYTREVWQGKEENGRVHVMGLTPDHQRVDGWVALSDVSSFTYECGCGKDTGRSVEDGPCGPFTMTSSSLIHFTNTWDWNACFVEGKTNKIDKLASPSVPSPATQSTESIEERLKKLEELRKKGLITPEEYEKKRAEILKAI